MKRRERNQIISIVIAYGLPAFLGGCITALVIRDVVLPLIGKSPVTKSTVREEKKPLSMQDIHEFVRKNRGTN